MYKIGQVLYIIANGTKTIEPIQVHSKQILESWDGTTVQHMCATVDNKTISLEKHSEKGLLAGVFESVDDAQTHLLQLASEMVASLAQKAKEKSSIFEPESTNLFPDRSSETSEVIQKKPLDEEVTTVILDDGTKARIHLPDDLK